MLNIRPIFDIFILLKTNRQKIPFNYNWEQEIRILTETNVN